jgi:hypothetical protein
MGSERNGAILRLSSQMVLLWMQRPLSESDSHRRQAMRGEVKHERQREQYERMFSQ